MTSWTSSGTISAATGASATTAVATLGAVSAVSAGFCGRRITFLTGVASDDPAEVLAVSLLAFLSPILELDLAEDEAVLGLSLLSLIVDFLSSLSTLVSFATFLIVLTRERGSLASAFSVMLWAIFFTCLAMMSFIFLSSLLRVLEADRLSFDWLRRMIFSVTLSSLNFFSSVFFAVDVFLYDATRASTTL